MKRQPTRPLLLGRTSPTRTSSESDLRSEGHRPTHPQQRSLHGLHPDIHDPNRKQSLLVHCLDTDPELRKLHRAQTTKKVRTQGLKGFSGTAAHITSDAAQETSSAQVSRTENFQHVRHVTCSGGLRSFWSKVAHWTQPRCSIHLLPSTGLGPNWQRAHTTASVSLILAWSSAFSHTSSAVPQVDATVSFFHMSAIRMKVADDLVSRKEAEIVMAQPFGSSAGSIATVFLRSLQGARETFDQDSPCLPRLEGAVGVLKTLLLLRGRAVRGCFSCHCSVDLRALRRQSLVDMQKCVRPTFNSKHFKVWRWTQRHLSQWLPGLLASMSRSSSPTSYLWEIAGFSQRQAADASSTMGRLSVRGSHAAGHVLWVFGRRGPQRA